MGDVILGAGMGYKNVIKYTKEQKMLLKMAHILLKKMRIIRYINQANIYLLVLVKEVI